MGSHKGADEVRAEHLLVFGAKLGPLYHALYNDLVWLHAKWLEFRKVFAHSPERIELLNESAGFFFRVVQDAMWENVLLHIARLTDPPRTGAFENLSFRQLTDAALSGALADDVNTLIARSEGHASFARVWRNKRLAHSDLSHALKQPVEPLPGVCRQDVDRVLEAFRAIMNRIHREFAQGEVGYQHFGACGDGDTLVLHLAVAHQAHRDREARMREGRALPGDYGPLPNV